MKSSFLLSFLFMVCIAVPAPAQNIWPVSFSYWFDCPDRYMPDLHGADHSIAQAQGLANLCDEEFRGAMQYRNQAMSQQELSRYNNPNMLPPIYPDSQKSESAKSPSSADKPSSSAPAAPPARTGSPSPSAPPPAAAPGPATKPVQSGGGSSAPPSSAPSPLPSPLSSPAAAAAPLRSDSRPSEPTPER
jgi:hypothetical protein